MAGGRTCTIRSLRRWLHRVDLPTLVLWGEADGFAKPSYGQSLAAALPSAELKLIPGAGHYPEIEQPEATIRAIDAFVHKSEGTIRMKVWHFSELAYTRRGKSSAPSCATSSRAGCAIPEVAADLYHRGLDEWALCDELGLNIMVNEHHATATCIDSVCTIPMAILARETKKARLLCLGMPIGNRFDAVRVAEEYSMLDVISRGRVEMGFVKGAPFEVTPANSNPADLTTRFWEAHDLILKAMTTP